MLYMATGKPAHLGCKFLSDVSVVNSPIVVGLLVISLVLCRAACRQHDTEQGSDYQQLHNDRRDYLLLTHLTKTYNLSEPAYLWPYTAYVLLMMGEIVARNM